MENVNFGRRDCCVAEKLFKEFSILYPNLSKEVCMWGEYRPNVIYIHLKDGRSLTYDIYQKVRFVKSEPDINRVDKPDLTKEEFISHVSWNIKNAMQKRNMTQKELSKSIGTTERNLTRYCSGARTPSLYSCYKIARALMISFDELLGL